LDVIGQQKTHKRLFMRVSWISLDYLGHFIGGAAGIEPHPRNAALMLNMIEGI